jgi:hypothetical protein
VVGLPNGPVTGTTVTTTHRSRLGFAPAVKVPPACSQVCARVWSASAGEAGPAIDPPMSRAAIAAMPVAWLRDFTVFSCSAPLRYWPNHGPLPPVVAAVERHIRSPEE